jgi:hypothetical protein
MLINLWISFSESLKWDNSSRCLCSTISKRLRLYLFEHTYLRRLCTYGIVQKPKGALWLTKYFLYIPDSPSVALTIH